MEAVALAEDEAAEVLLGGAGVAQPADNDRYGYLSEHHPFGETDERAGEYAEDLAATIFHVLGILDITRPVVPVAGPCVGWTQKKAGPGWSIIGSRSIVKRVSAKKTVSFLLFRLVRFSAFGRRLTRPQRWGV